MKYSRNDPPKPVEETPELVRIEDEYDDDFNLIPSDGMLHDFYYHTLGWEITNFYVFWSAIAGLSSLASRDVHLKSAMDLYPNFYVIIVGPPGLAHKSTAMKLWSGAEKQMWDHVSPHIAERKNVPMIRSKATPEFLFTQMKNRELEHDSGKESDAILKVRVSELDNFLSRASYNSTLISKLTDFYDCSDYDTDGVLGRNNGKLVEIRNIYASLFGCTTPTALKDTLPEEAFGGGFMSRATIVNQTVDDLKRIVDWPFYPEDAPDKEELGHRLAWIATYKNGQYTLTSEAMNLYRRWYAEVHHKIVEKVKKGDGDDRDNRLTTQALKLATLLSYQRYELERRVTWQDMASAINILDYTLEKATSVLDDVRVSFSTDAKLLKFYRDVRHYGDEGVDQRTLGRTHKYKVDEIKDYFFELKSRGLMEMETIKTGEGANGRAINKRVYRVIDEIKEQKSEES